MTGEFNWSRGLFSGAFSLASLCAAAITPLAGRVVDRYGSGVAIAAGSAVTGVCALGLALVSQVWAFYALFVPARLMFSSFLEIGPSTAINNWFIRRRPMMLALLSVNQGVGQAIMPLAAQLIITGWGWRAAWASLGVYTIAVGSVLPLFFLARRPEDLGLEPDPEPSNTVPMSSSFSRVRGRTLNTGLEASFTVRQALRTRALWSLALYAGVCFMAQAGISLHLASHYINQGLPSSSAALTVSAFAVAQMASSPIWSKLTSWFSVRVLMALSGLGLGVSSFAVASSSSLQWGVIAAFLVGTSISGPSLLLRLACADYYGRQNLGSIYGLILSALTGGQAVGPILAGLMFDLTHSYRLPFLFFAVAASVSALLVLSATPPSAPNATAGESVPRKTGDV
jgi:MFS family permease